MGYRTIIDEIIDALTRMGGRAPLWHISYEIRQNRRFRGDHIPETIEIAVRRALEERCARSCFYRGASDLFAMPEDPASGAWSINHAEALRQRRMQFPDRYL
jgi:hypothetical protein